MRVSAEAIDRAIAEDPDVLAFFKAGGPGYQSRMHAVLRAYVDHQRRRQG